MGDLGRSPRTVNQALALARAGAQVTLAGYEGSALCPDVVDQRRITVRYIPPPRPIRRDGSTLRFLLGAGLRLVRQHLQLARLFWCSTPGADAIVVQNPPSAPVLAMAWLASRLRGGRFIIDWHNLGHAMLALRLVHARESGVTPKSFVAFINAPASIRTFAVSRSS